MDLSFGLGLPLSEVRRMPLADLEIYARYTRRRGFPGRRLEMLLAQVSLVLAQVNGNDHLRLSQFLFDPVDPEQQAQQRARDLDEFFNA